MLTRTFFARAPLAPGRFAPLPAGAVRARGAMKEKLVSLRGGLLSRCASLFVHCGEDAAFYGGTLEGGVSAGNLLEAMLLTSAALCDDELRRQALRLADMVIACQREDGSFGAKNESFAARGRMLRALAAAYTMTGDKRMLTFMLRYMKYLKDTLSDTPLSGEDAMHTADTLEAGVFLYNVTGQKAILSVLMTLISSGADYTSLFHAFPYRTPVSRSFSEEALRSALENESSDGYTHHLLRTANTANLCEGLRASALCGVLTGSGKHLSAAEVGLTRMRKSHGAVCGGVTGDPLLAGTHPSRGVTAVSLCELAASLEALLSCPAGEHGADALETVLYNGIAAAFAPDMLSVQPVQQANQVLLSREKRFPLSAEDCNLFSTDDEHALTALLAAYPRFIAHQWMCSRDGGLAAMGYAPCQVRYRLGSAGVRLTVDSDYPASSSVRITVSLSESAAFPLHLRIPAWAKGASAAIGGEITEGAAGGFLTLNRQWHDGDEILLTLPMTVERSIAFHQAVSISRGPLRFAYVPAVSCDGGVMQAAAPFGAALRHNAPLESVMQGGCISLRTRAVSAPRWGVKAASCDQPPIALSDGAEGTPFDAILLPYAASPIRLSVLPQV
ncbi:MAG: glycoside hydrolase family 127 protein [Clostridia bacterium]|nr:glycoside hydrolase family 127 protein [Clostridia bacterium]